MLHFPTNFLAIFASVLLLIGVTFATPSDREDLMDVDRTPAETICQQAREKIKEYREMAQRKEDKQVVAKAVEKLEQYGQRVPENREMLGNMANMLKQFSETLPKAEIPENEKMLGTLLADYYCAKLKRKAESEGKQAESLAELDLDAEKETWTRKGLQDFSVRGEKMFDQLNHKFGVTDEQLLMSLSSLEVNNGGGKSNNLFYMSTDTKFLIKSLKESNDEPETIQAVLDKYARYMLGEDGDRSKLNRFHMAFQAIVWKDFKVKDSAGKEIKDEQGNEIIEYKLVPLHFIVINNIFHGVDQGDLLKFDVKGVFSPGSAVQYDQTEKFWIKSNFPQGPRDSVYREFDFLGIDRTDAKGKHRKVAPFFNNGIEMDGEVYRQLMERLDKDVKYLLSTNVNDYSLLLGVHFLPEGEEASSANNCIPAKCRNCKRVPDAPYQSEHRLCLYMGFVDLLTPSNARQQRYFRIKYKKFRKVDLKNLADLPGQQKEDTAPIPAAEFAGRLLGAVAGCVFRPSGLPSNSIEQFRHALIGAICRSYGEDRAAKIKKLREVVGQREEAKLQNEMETEDETEIGNSWLPSKELQHNQDGITVHALEVFKEMMDNWRDHSWQLLRSLSDGMFNVLHKNKERQIELVSTEDGKYLLKRLTEREWKVFEDIFGNYLGQMANSEGQSSLLPRYYAIVRDQKKNVFVVMNNVFSASLDFAQKFALNAEPREPSQPPHFIYPGLLTTAPPQNGIQLTATAYETLITQLDQDATFLQEHHLWDYSMQVGLDEGKFAQKSTKQMPNVYEQSSKMVLGLADILNQQHQSQVSANYFHKFMCMMATKVLASESEQAMKANDQKYCGSGHGKQQQQEEAPSSTRKSGKPQQQEIPEAKETIRKRIAKKRNDQGLTK